MERSAGPSNSGSNDSATSIRADLEDARRAALGIAELLDSLLERANAVKRETDQMVEALDGALSRTPGDGVGEGGKPEDRADPLAPSAGARLLATQLVVGGSSREEIEKRLREEFGIENTAAMLDKIFGSEGDSG